MASSRRFATGAAAAMLLALPAAARADEPVDKQACLQSYEKAQVHMGDHKLSLARAALVICTNDACPALLRKDCLGWMHDLDAQQPTLAFRVVDEHDRDL